MPKLYFCGIGGIGMSALAQLCLHRGFEVSGSDPSPSALTQHLEGLGIQIFNVQEAENITPDFDLLVYTEAVPPDNPERVKAEQLGLPQKSYFEYLGELSKDLRTVAIAGTHGKTTTTAMLGEALIKSGFDATVVVGSRAKGLGNNNFHAGSNEWLIVEACEYRNNFQYLNPEIVVLTNLEWDHPDAFPDEASYLQVFRDFCAKARTVIYHEGDEMARSVISPNSQELVVRSDQLKRIALKIPGEHNRENAALAMAVGHQLITNNSSLTTFSQALQNFSGTARRQEYLQEYQGRPVYDDYGHHPTEISSTLQAFREGFPGREIALIFQPHQFSRTRHFVDEFRESFHHADHVALVPIFRTRDQDEDIEAVSIEDLAGEDYPIIGNTSQLQDFVTSLPENTLLLFMGAGDISPKLRRFLGGGEF